MQGGSLGIRSNQQLLGELQEPQSIYEMELGGAHVLYYPQQHRGLWWM